MASLSDRSEIAPLSLVDHAGERLFELALEACPQAISLVDVRHPEQPLVYVNHAFELLTGYPRAEVLGRNCRLLQGVVDPDVNRRMREAIDEGDRAVVTVLNLRKDGSCFTNELFLEPIRNGEGSVTHFVGLQTDVSERDRRLSASQGSVAARRTHALPDRDALDERIEHSLIRTNPADAGCALLLVELSLPEGKRKDDAAADARLDEVAALLNDAMPDAGSPFRLSEKRLALLLDPAPKPTRVAEVARRVLKTIGDGLAARDNRASCHIGVAMGPRDGASAQELTLAAGRALDRARLRSSADELSFFAHAQDARFLYLRQMETDLAEAIAQQQFSLVYEPIVQLDTAYIIGFEALIRWTHPVRGPVPPSEFIPVAEANGMIAKISEWVIDRALSQLAVFDRLSTQALRMFINISPSQFVHPGFVDTLRAQLSRYQVKPGRVELEITERTVTDNAPATQQAMRALRKLGISIAVDDFGTGYSNLYNLTQLPIDTLKIDMSLTHGVTHSTSAASVSRMICELGRTLELKVVVEGIETEGQLNHFRELSCPYGQGYLFSKAVEADEACALLRDVEPLFRATPHDRAPHLLLLDDDENILAALRRLLRREGYHIYTAKSPQEAFEILATHPIGVVLSDQRMPQMTGTEFLRQVKKLHPHTVRMVLSGFSEIKAVTDAVNEGAIWRFLSKPWDDVTLRDEIRLAFAEHKALRDAAEEHADALKSRVRLEGELSQRDQHLDLKAHALESARETLSMLPIPVLGIDPTLMVVMSNVEADRLFGGGTSLMGQFLSALFPPEVEQALVGLTPVEVQLSGRPYLLHVQALEGGAEFKGQLLCLIPRGDE